MRNFLKFLVVIGLVLVVNKANSQQFLGGGTGTADDPYKIYTAAQWDEFAEEYFYNNNSFDDFSNIHIRLMNDLTGEDKITKFMCGRAGTSRDFNGYFHGGGNKIDISDIVFYVNYDVNSFETEIHENSFFSRIGESGIIDSLEIVGISKNFNSIVDKNCGKLDNLTCNIICEPTQEIYHGFFLEYAV